MKTVNIKNFVYLYFVFFQAPALLTFFILLKIVQIGSVDDRDVLFFFTCVSRDTSQSVHCFTVHRHELILTKNQ